MARICSSSYPIEKVMDSPYPYPYPVIAEISCQNRDMFGQYKRGRVYLPSLRTGMSTKFYPSSGGDETKV